MSTAVLPRVLGPVLVGRIMKDVPAGVAGLATADEWQQGTDLAIHRISREHHGRTLLMLGHAAEHLANSRRFAVCERDDGSDAEAIHLLMGLSRAVFDDLAGRHTRRRRAEQWLMQWIAEKVEDRAARRALESDNGRPQADCVTC